MKKIVTTCFITMAMLASLGNVSSSVYAESNSAQIDNAIIQEGRVLVPLRGIFEELGAAVKWDQKKKEVTATQGKNKIWLKVGSKKTKVNNKDISIDVPAQVTKGSTYVPLRFISEALGAKVNWSPDTQTATIIKNDKKIVVTSIITDLQTIKYYASIGTTEVTKAIKAGEQASNVIKKLGKPEMEYQYRDHQIYEYNGKIPFTIGLLGGVEDPETESYLINKQTKIDFINSNIRTLTYAQIKQVLGEPEYSLYDYMTEGLQIKYTLGKYGLFFSEDPSQFEGEQELNDSVRFNQITVRVN